MRAGGALVAVLLAVVATSTSVATSAGEAAAGPASSKNATVCYRAGSEPGAQPHAFTDVTRDAGLAALAGRYGHATAVGDVDADGWTDLFFGGFADKVDSEAARNPDQLLLGGPDGFRVDSSFRVDPGRTSGAAFADLDADDDLDLVLSRNVRSGERADAPSVVLRNDGGHFTQATLLDARRSGRSIGVLDYDADGRLDLFLVGDRFGVSRSSALFHNDGDLRFSDATADAGLPTRVHGLGVAAADFDGDGRPDLFVSDSNRLFLNGDDGTFREVEAPELQWEPIGDEDDAAGVAVGDLNRDGRIDLVVGQHYNSTLDRDARVPVRLFLNQGNGGDGTPRFRDATRAAGLVPLPTKAPHVEIVDLDDDGWPDILTTASADDGTRPAVFYGRGIEDGVPRFDAPDRTGAPQYWIAGATLDADHDGDLDVFLVEFDTERSSPLLRNDGTGSHWLGIQIGRSGARGIGASVEVYRAGRLRDTSQLLGARNITASTGFGSGSLPIAFFGLGDQSRVDVVVTAAGAGRDAAAVTLRRVRADRLLQVAVDEPCAARPAGRRASGSVAPARGVAPSAWVVRAPPA
jgi:hypothetical protein